MTADAIVLLTDHGSREGSRRLLTEAVSRLTGRAPVLMDARDFSVGGRGRASVTHGRLRLEAPGQAPVVAPAAAIVYEIPPDARRQLAPLQGLLHASGTACLGTDARAWRTASDKALMVRRFARAGIAQMPTLCLPNGDGLTPVEAYERLSGDVWARPVCGMGGQDVFHLTTHAQLHTAAAHYARTGTRWLLSQDAQNYTAEGLRHQFRVIVLGGRVIWAAEQVQRDPDTPCNVAQGAVPTVLAPGELPAYMEKLAVAAAASVGLPFAGLDLAAENGGVVFEVNVHPAFDPNDLHGVAIPYVQAHLDRISPPPRTGTGRHTACEPENA